MYFLIFLICFGTGGVLIASGLSRHRRGLTTAGIVVTVGTLLLMYLLNFWVDMLWFDELGFAPRFWKAFLIRVAATVVTTVAAAALMALTIVPVFQRRRAVYGVAVVLAGLIGFLFGSANWQTVLIYLNRVMPETVDPILEKSTGFYLFSLPFYTVALQLLFVVMAVALAAAAFTVFVSGRRPESFSLRMPGEQSESAESWRPLYVPLGGLLVAAAGKLYLRGFGLMYSTAGVVTGPGWTDVYVRLPIYRLSAILALLVGVLLLIPWLRRAWKGLVKQIVRRDKLVEPGCLLLGPAVPGFVLLVGVGAAAPVLQWLRVEPNEISLEKPFIEHNIQFTRRAYNLDIIEETDFTPSEKLDRAVISDNRDVLAETRLWDWRALESVYRQFQEIRLYYTLNDVDVDRYHINGRYRQVMVSPREIDLGALPEKSQTFVNRRFKYTHGYGMTMSLVSEFTQEGLPRLLVRDIPPVAEYESLTVDTPQIYYGTVFGPPAVVNSREEEFDYPKGDSNVYNHYSGTGGIALKNLWRKFILGTQVGGTRFFFSRYPKKDSRVMLYRNVRQRIQRVAPFLKLDTDPYIVVSEGELWWIVDAYTLSSKYPYSEQLMPYQFSSAARGHGIAAGNGVPRELLHMRGANYIRNSIKAVINAHSGDVALYVFDPEDPILAVWRKTFPGLFKDRADMPEHLEAHVRYPATMLLVQGLAYAQYHMENPDVFYNQEDLWVRATEKYYSQVQPVEPYYIMWELPENDQPEFAVILPFTPKNKQVLIGWIAGLCDNENYGRLLAYKLPKKRRVLGPQQVETKIDQDRFLSGQLSLWDQRGSRVIRGNLLALPIGDTLLYVEPIYLQADTAAYPELRLVAVMHEDNLSYAETFDEALRGLFEDRPTPTVLPGAPRKTPGGRDVSVLIENANNALNRYLDHTGAGEFEQAGKALDELSRAVQALANAQGPASSTKPQTQQGKAEAENGSNADR